MNARELKRLVSAASAERRARDVSARLEPAAREARLLDVGIATTHSPLGDLLVAVTPAGIARIAYPEEDRDLVLGELATQLSPRILESATMTDEIRRELDEYFEGRRHTFDVSVDWRSVHGFALRTLRTVSRVSFGSLTTYGNLAASIGNPGAARAVGNALGSNPIPIVVPCHRVVRSQGGLGGYSGGTKRKRFLLDLEGADPRSARR